MLKNIIKFCLLISTMFLSSNSFADLIIGSDHYRLNKMTSKYDIYYSTYSNLFSGNTNYATSQSTINLYSIIQSTFNYLNLKNDSTSYIWNTQTLQSGATIFVDSGTINDLYCSSLTINNSSISIDGISYKFPTEPPDSIDAVLTHKGGNQLTWKIPEINVFGGGSQKWYLQEKLNSEVNNKYETMLTTPSTESEEIESVSLTAGNGFVMISSHAISNAQMGYVKKIPAGTGAIHYHARVDAAVGESYLLFKFSTSTLDGVTGKTEWYSSTGTEINNTDSLATFIDAGVLTQEINTSTNTAIILEIYARTTSAASRTIYLAYMGNENVSYVDTPINSVATFLQLEDTPNTYSGSNDKLLVARTTDNVHGEIVFSNEITSATITNFTSNASTITNLNVSKLRISTSMVETETVLFEDYSGVGLKLSNNYGFISLTPLNLYYAHIYTDRNYFIFNKPVLSLVNSFSSYNNNLLLQRNLVTKLTLAQSLATFENGLTVKGDITSTGTATMGYFSGDGSSVYNLSTQTLANQSQINSTMTQTYSLINSTWNNLDLRSIGLELYRSTAQTWNDNFSISTKSYGLFLSTAQNRIDSLNLFRSTAESWNNSFSASTKSYSLFVSTAQTWLDNLSRSSQTFNLFLSTGQAADERDRLFLSTAQTWMNNFSVSTKSYSLFLSSAQVMITYSSTTSNTFNLFRSTAELTDNRLSLFRSTAEARIDSLNLFRSTAQSSIDSLNLFRSTAQTKIDSWMLFKSTGEAADERDRLFVSTAQTRLNNLDLSTASLTLTVSNTNYVNLSGSTQTKSGSLNILGNLRVGENVDKSTAAALIDVNGNVAANSFALRGSDFHDEDNTPFYGKQKVVTNDYLNQCGNFSASTSTWRVLTNKNYVWYGAATSYDGKYQTIAGNGNPVFVSSDNGATFVQTHTSAAWNHLSMSADGKHQLLAGQSTCVVTSSDYGKTWNPVTAFTGSFLFSAVSAKGDIMTIVDGSKLYMSRDYGKTWRSAFSKSGFTACAMSADGTVQAASVFNDNVYITTNNWNSSWSIGVSQYWYCVTMSNDAKFMTALAYKGSPPNSFYTSDDYGKTWTQKAGLRNVLRCYMSGDGSKEFATVYGGSVAITYDRWSTYTQFGSTADWTTGAISPDGSTLIAGEASSVVPASYYGKIYVSTLSKTFSVAQGTISIKGDIVASGKIIASDRVYAPGQILQIGTTIQVGAILGGKMPIFSAPTTSNGTQVAALNFTPLSSSSTLIIEGAANTEVDIGDFMIIALYDNIRGTTAIASNNKYNVVGTGTNNMNIMSVIQSTSTTTRTISMRYGNLAAGSGSPYVNFYNQDGNIGGTYIKVTEIQN